MLLRLFPCVAVLLLAASVAGQQADSDPADELAQSPISPKQYTGPRNGTANTENSESAEDTETIENDYAKKYLRYASFGDSWSSGINYGPPSEALEYNFPNQSEICRCRRGNEAWPVQLRDNVNNVTNTTQLPEWTGGRLVDLDFQACHASYFNAIPDQIARLNQTHAPEFATLMIGGNPGGFPDILFNCVFWPEHNKDYGPEFPDPNGECWKAIQRAKLNVHSQWFVEGILRSIALILTEPRIRTNPDFKLYVLGYAELFNDEDTACDDFSFGVWPGKKPLLKTDLRKEINAIIHAGRLLYNRILNSPLFGDMVEYVDINHIFEDRRFCEPTLNNTIEQQNDQSWLYNLVWPECIPLAEDDDGSDRMRDANLTDPASWPTFCRKCGSLLEYGEFNRPFHPKPIAHNAIQSHLVEIIADTLKRAPETRSMIVEGPYDDSEQLFIHQHSHARPEV